jgi:PAS domain S-box-containing protein
MPDLANVKGFLLDSQRQLQDLNYALDAAAIVARTDRAGRITFVNDKFCEISGYARHELIGQDHRLVNSGTHTAEFMSELWRTIGDGKVWRGEIRNRAKDGNPYWVDTTIVPLFDAEGLPHEFIAIRFDITARKEAEARLRNQAAMTQLGEMATIMAHEVRNPLAGIAGALQIIHDRLPVGGEERNIVMDMRERLHALNARLTDVLSFARPQALQLAEHDLRQMTEAVVAQVREDPKFSALVMQVSGENVVCLVDAVLLQGALLNLALNAAQAMAGTGRIRFDIETRGERVVCSVADDGPGIPMAVRARVFRPFFTTKSHGTGLGLAIVRRVVEQHGGEISLHCPPAGGTVVRMVLPVRSIQP